MTREEETAERNACDEYFHEHKPVSIQDMWMERARRAKAHPIYQLHMADGTWSDVEKWLYDRFIEEGAEEAQHLRIVYADQSGDKEGV